MDQPDTSSSNQINVERLRRARDACAMLSFRSISLGAALLALIPATAAAQAVQGRTCKTGQLFAGSPTYRMTGNEKMAYGGMGLTDEPPLQWRTLVFSGKTLYTNNGQEIWAADLTAGKVKRIAGSEK